MKKTILLFLILFLLSIKASIGPAFVQASQTITVCATGTAGQGGCDYIGGDGIQQAVDSATDGDTVLIKNGEYNLTDPIDLGIWGSQRKDINFRGEGNTIINSPTEYSSFYTKDSNLTLKGIVFTGIGGIQILDNSKVEILGNKFIDTVNSISHFILVSGVNTETTVKNNIFFVGKNEEAYQGIIGIDPLEPIKEMIIENNSFLNGSLGLYFYSSGQIIVKNNIFYSVDHPLPHLPYDPKPSVCQYNIFYDINEMANVDFCGNNVLADPMFFDSNNANFHLQPNSPAINAGDPSILDPDGSRSDMGAYGGPGACGLDSSLPGCSVSNPSPTPTITSPPNCSLKSQGDADCDNSIDNNDYNIWKCEYKGGGICSNPYSDRTADFDLQAGVNIVDFEIFRRGRNRLLMPPVAVATPTNTPTPTPTPIPVDINITSPSEGEQLSAVTTSIGVSITWTSYYSSPFPVSISLIDRGNNNILTNYSRTSNPGINQLVMPQQIGTGNYALEIKTEGRYIGEDVNNFAVVINDLCAATLTNPPNGSIVNSKPYLEWEPCMQGDIRHEVKITGDGMPYRTFIMDYNALPTTSLSFQPGKIYTWKVRVCLNDYCDSGFVGPWSNNYTFQYKTPPPTPTPTPTGTSWHLGNAGESCTQVCGANSKQCASGNWGTNGLVIIQETDYCSGILVFSPDSYAPYKSSQDNKCYVRGNLVIPPGLPGSSGGNQVVNQDCNASSPTAQRICLCN